MPTNLPPEYFDAEKRYKEAATSQEKIAALEALISNESTDGWVSGILRNADLLMLVIDLSEDPDVQAGLCPP